MMKERSLYIIMKLTINLMIRKALLVAMTAGSVNYAMANPVIADMTTQTVGTPLPTLTDNDGIILDYTGGYTGGNIRTFSSTTGIYIKDALESAASGNGGLYMIGDLKSYTVLAGLDGYVAPTDADSGNIQFRNGGTDSLPHANIYYGDHSEFEGDFIMASTNAGRNKDFFFGNATDASSNMSDVAGTGAIEFGVRTGVEGAANTAGTDLANASVGNISFFYAGAASIGNTHINANNITLNGAASGSVTSDNFKTSLNAVGTDGATYTITSALNINALNLRDGSDAILSGEKVATISTVNYEHANSSLTISNASSTIGAVNMTSAGSSLSITSTGSSIANINFGNAGNTASIAADAALTLTGTQTLFAAGQIDVAGTLTLDSTVRFDINSIDSSLWQVSGNTYTLQLIDIVGAGVLEGFSDLNKTDNLIYTGSSIYDISFTPTGSITYTKASKDLDWSGGAGVWNTTDSEWLDGSDASTFAQGDSVTFGASAVTDNEITIVGAINAESITVDSDQNYSFIGSDGVLGDPASLVKSGMGTLSISTANTYSAGTTLNAGTLLINNDAALGTGAITINGGTLGFFGGGTVTIDSNRLTLTNGALNVALEDSTTASLTGAAGLGSHTLNVEGQGTLVYTSWVNMSSVDVAAGATVNFSSANGSSNNNKIIKGDGTIIIDFSHEWGSRMSFDSSDLFTGTLELKASAQSYLSIEGSSANSRMGLKMVAGADLILFASTHSTLYLNELSGEGIIRYDWGYNSVQKRHIDLQMSANNTFDGTFSPDGDRMGNLTVSSVEGEIYNFTMKKNGYTGSDNTKTLNVENAKVIFYNAADWRGNIALNQSKSELHYAGSDYTRTASMGAISGDGELHINANVTLQGANTYSGGTVIHGDSLTVEHVDALGSGSVRMIDGALNLSGLAVDNAVSVEAGSISGFSAYTGALTVKSSLNVTDRIAAGSIRVDTSGSLTLSGEWDYSSQISIEGSLIFGSDLIIDLTDITFNTSDNSTYSLTLFSGAGSSDLSAWLGAGNIVDAGKLTGETEGYVYTLNNGVLSYTAGYFIPDGTGQTISGGASPDITLGGASAEVTLGDGFGQAEGSSITGPGDVIVAANATVSLSEANNYSGGTLLRAGSIVNVNANDALGSRAVSSMGDSQLILNAGVTMRNNVYFDDTGQISAGALTVAANQDRASIENSGSDALAITHTATGEGTITDAVLNDMTVTLAADGTGSITNSRLYGSTMDLGERSTMTMTGISLNGSVVTLQDNATLTLIDSIQGIGSSISNNNATLNLVDHTIQVSSAVDGGLTIKPDTESITTLDGGTHEMTVYSLTSITMQNVSIKESLTLDIVLTTEFADFEILLNSKEMIAFELQGVKEDQLNTWYGDVTINVYNGDLTLLGESFTALGYSSSANGHLVFYIPEPSTATLSLLALAGLLARRRRKNEN